MEKIKENTAAGMRDDALVKIREYLPEIFIDLRYASKNNFTGQAIYDFSEPLLRCGTVKKLKKALEMLKEYGYSLKIWDAYRPVSAQFRLFEICPDPTFVADPRTGFSDHSRGGAVDLTLCTLSGKELDMPSTFDDFSPRARRNYSACTKEQAANARLLEQVLYACGFTGYEAEWWHYTDTDPYAVIPE